MEPPLESKSADEGIIAGKEEVYTDLVHYGPLIIHKVGNKECIRVSHEVIIDDLINTI